MSELKYEINKDGSLTLEISRENRLELALGLYDEYKKKHHIMRFGRYLQKEYVKEIEKRIKEFF